MMCRLQRLSIVRICPKEVIHMKKATFKGVFDLHILFQGKE